MNIKEDVEKLARAGSEYTVWMGELRKATDNLARYLASVLPDEETKLPRYYLFRHYSDGQYSLERRQRVGYQGETPFELREGWKPRKSLLEFAEDVADGWLDEVTAYLEKETAQFRGAAKKTGVFIGT